MSIPPPDHHYFKKQMAQDLSSLEIAVSSLFTPTAYDKAKQNVVDVQKIFEDAFSEESASQDAMRRIENRAKKVLSTLVRSSRIPLNRRRFSSESRVEEIVHSLLNHIHLYAEYITHQDPKKPSGIEENLKHSWAQECLEILISEENEWAKGVLKEQMGKSNAYAYEIAVLNANDSAFIQNLLKPLFENKLFQAFLKNFIKTRLPVLNPKKQKAFFKTLTYLYQDSKWKWLQLYIHDQFMKAGALEPLQGWFESSCLDASLNEAWFDYLFNQLQTENPHVIQWLCDFICSIEQNDSLIQKSAFFKRLFQKTLSDPSFLTLGLTLFYGITLEETFAHLLLRESLDSSLVTPLFHPMQKAAEFWKTAFSTLYRTYRYTDDPFFWNHAEPKDRFSLAKALLDSDFKLIQCLKGEIEHSHFVDQHQDDGFKRPEALMSGFSEAAQDLFDELSKILSPQKVDAVALASLERNPKPGLPERTLMTDQVINIWLRDYFSVYQNSLRLNAFFPFPEHIFKQVKDHRKMRVSEAAGKEVTDIPFSVMGQSMTRAQPIRIFHHLEKWLQEGSNRSLSYNFLMLEGGNVLKGTSKGQPYALVGKDVLSCNRIVLAEKLSRMGLKMVDGAWQIDQPYDSSEVELSDALLLDLLAKDLGLKSPDQILLIEQAHYHLDVQMMILDAENKVVALNDSELVAQTEIKLIRNMRSKPECTKEIDEVLQVREDLVQQKANHFKPLEELAQQDLEAHGFKVVRFAGNVHDTSKRNPNLYPMMRFNTLGFLNSEGQKELIACGVIPELKDETEAFYLENIPELKKVHFLPWDLSIELMINGGGIHCCAQFINKSE